MIFGKINPVISIATQDGLFNPSPTFITGSYVAAVANQYPLGANQVNFRVSYGQCTFGEDGSVTEFKTVYADNIILSGEAIETWGTDDSVILNAIATQQGTSIVEIVSGSANGMFF